MAPAHQLHQKRPPFRKIIEDHIISKSDFVPQERMTP
jgi:hypothetical protein